MTKKNGTRAQMPIDAAMGKLKLWCSGEPPGDLHEWREAMQVVERELVALRGGAAGKDDGERRPEPVRGEPEASPSTDVVPLKTQRKISGLNAQVQSLKGSRDHALAEAGKYKSALEQSGSGGSEKAWRKALDPVMPADFKDWWEGSRNERPYVAADVIRSLRAREDLAWEQSEAWAKANARLKSGVQAVLQRCDLSGEARKLLESAIADSVNEPSKEGGLGTAALEEVLTFWPASNPTFASVSKAEIVDAVRLALEKWGGQPVGGTGAKLSESDESVARLLAKAKAVVTRWDSPLWKDLPHTGESINELRSSIEAYESRHGPSPR